MCVWWWWIANLDHFIVEFVRFVEFLRFFRFQFDPAIEQLTVLALKLSQVLVRFQHFNVQRRELVAKNLKRRVLLRCDLGLLLERCFEVGKALLQCLRFELLRFQLLLEFFDVLVHFDHRRRILGVSLVRVGQFVLQFQQLLFARSAGDGASASERAFEFLEFFILALQELNLALVLANVLGKLLVLLHKLQICARVSGRSEAKNRARLLSSISSRKQCT